MLFGCGCAGVIAAAALKCMGGTMQGRLWPRSDEERKKAEEAGYDISKVSLPASSFFHTQELVHHGLPSAGFTDVLRASHWPMLVLPWLLAVT